MWGHSYKDASCNPLKEPSSNTESPSTLILDFPASRKESKSLLLESLFLRQPEQINTTLSVLLYIRIRVRAYNYPHLQKRKLNLGEIK